MMELTEEEQTLWDKQRKEAGDKAGVRVYCSPGCVEAARVISPVACTRCMRLSLEYAQLLSPGIWTTKNVGSRVAADHA